MKDAAAQALRNGVRVATVASIMFVVLAAGGAVFKRWLPSTWNVSVFVAPGEK